MKLSSLIIREISHRRLNFAMTLLSTAMAVATMIAAISLLQADDVRTREVLAEKETAVKEAGAALEDSMRLITKGLGFNVTILPENQDLHEMQVEGTFSKMMPEEYVTTLANSNIVTVNHLLPTIVQKMTWPEKDLAIVLYGTRGEVPIAHRDPKKPLLEAVPRGTMIIGFQIAKKLDLQAGDQVDFKGSKFEIVKTHAERGTIDDSTVWINLAEAQELLGKQNLIHAIQALECQCAGDRLGQIRAEISAVLPGTQVIESGDRALARAEARNTAKETAIESLKREQASRASLESQHESFASWLVAIVALGSAVWVGMLAIVNVRQRRPEIAILRAIGLRSSQILCVFLGKACLAGLFGSIAGLLGGLIVGAVVSTSIAGVSEFNGFQPGLMLAACVMAPLLALLGSWLPALSAVGQDPAIVLQED